MEFGAWRQLPRRRDGHVTAVTIGGEAFRLSASQCEDGTLGEVLVGWVTRDDTAAGLVDGYAMALTAGLEHGVPLKALLRPGLGMRFAPGGRTDDPEIPHVRSVADYVSRRLAIDWLPREDRLALGVLTPFEQARPWLAADRGPSGGPQMARSPFTALAHAWPAPATGSLVPGRA